MRIKVTGLEKAVRKLEAYKKSLEGKTHVFLEHLAQVGIDVADVAFRTAQYDGENDVVVSGEPEWIDDNTLVITASGSAVKFIEFGTGVHYTEQHPKAGEMGMVRGEYGQGKGSQDSWGYYGNPGTNGRVVKENGKGSLVITHGNPPARAMYDAGKEMREQVRAIAKEVFGND